MKRGIGSVVYEFLVNPGVNKLIAILANPLG